MSPWERQHALGPVLEALRTPVELVLGDLQGSRPIEIDVGGERQADPETESGWMHVVWFLEPGGSGVGFQWDGETGAELLVRIADYLQEQLFPETRQAWGEARPSCPGHQHPAFPAVTDGEAWWHCPVTDEPLARIGTLGEKTPLP